MAPWLWSRLLLVLREMPQLLDWLLTTMLTAAETEWEGKTLKIYIWSGNSWHRSLILGKKNKMDLDKIFSGTTLKNIYIR